MKTFEQFFFESVEQKSFRIKCDGLAYSCDPISIEKPQGTPLRSFMHTAKSKFLARAFYKLNPRVNIHQFIKQHYNNCAAKLL